MKLLTRSVLCTTVLCVAVLSLPLLVHAQSCTGPACITIGNSDGTFVSNTAQTSLSVMGTADESTLFTVTGIGAGYDCGTSGTPACSAGARGSSTFSSVTLQTGTIMAGGTSNSLTPTTGLSTWLGGGAGTSFSVTEAARTGVTGNLNGFTFSGIFSSAAGANTWSCLGTCKANKTGTVITSYTGTWVLNASIVDGVLTIGGQTYNITSAASVQLTTINATVAYKSGKALTFTDHSGSTEFPSPVPEPGTLSLLGGGLIAVGILSKRLGSRTQRARVE